MKKLNRKLLSLLASATLLCALAACSNDDDGDSGGSSSSNTGSASQTSSVISSPIAVAKGAAYTGTFTLDLSNMPLSKDGVTALNDADSDFSECVSVLTRTAEIAPSASIAARAATSDAGADGDVSEAVTSAKVTSATTTKVVFELTYQAPNADGVVIVNVTVPEEYTEEEEEYSATVGVLKVGDGVAVSEATTTFTIESKMFYRCFEGSSSFHLFSDGILSLVYDNGALTLTYADGRDRDGEHDSWENTEPWAMRKIGNDLYIAKVYRRMSGSGLFATFCNTIEKTRTVTSESENFSVVSVEDEIVTLSSTGVAQRTVKETLKDSSGISADELAEWKEELESEFFQREAAFYTNDGGKIESDALEGDWYYDGDALYYAYKASDYNGALPPTFSDY